MIKLYPIHNSLQPFGHSGIDTDWLCTAITLVGASQTEHLKEKKYSSLDYTRVRIWKKVSCFVLLYFIVIYIKYRFSLCYNIITLFRYFAKCFGKLLRYSIFHFLLWYLKVFFYTTFSLPHLSKLPFPIGRSKNINSF